VVGGLNALSDDIQQGRRVFYDVYTDRQKAEEPEKVKTFLFFLRGRPGVPLAVVAPAAASRMSGRFTKASPTPSPFAAGRTTPSS
jgi:hypothetical protein